MKFLHTADIHLKKGEEKRLEVFGWLLKRAGELGVDYFIIAGDLFDSDSDATILRQEIRRMCEPVRFKLLVIPGNHDAGSYGPTYEYGANMIQLTDRPFQIIESGGLKICGVPYDDRRFSDCARDMPHDIDVLIAHGTLYDQSFIFPLLEEEDQETKYMPIFPVDLEGIGRYVALGHLHSRFIELRYKGTHVAYPGSPTSIDTKCLGIRSFQLVDIDEKRMEVEKHVVDIAPYYMTREFFVYPGIEETILREIENFITNIKETAIMPIVTVAGYIGGEEKRYLAVLSSMQESCKGRFEDFRMNVDVQSWDKLIANPLIQKFVAKTGGLRDELRLKIFEIAFPVFSKALK